MGRATLTAGTDADEIGQRSADRILAFTDAVVAIAMTLLVLPIVDQFVTTLNRRDATIGALFDAHGLQSLISFAISFAVIARLWFAHHEQFRLVRFVSSPLVAVDMAWAFTIVTLPLASAISSGLATSSAVIAIYVGTMTVSAALLTTMSVMLYRGEFASESPDRRDFGRAAVIGGAGTFVAFALALILGILFPQIGFYWLLLLAATTPFESMVLRRWRRRSASAHG